jgi:tetratricopeptide (TPR) repeat protein
MDYQEYLQAAKEAAGLIDVGHLKEAEAALYKLIFSEISDVDRGILCVRMASVYDKMGDTDHALEWYNKAIAAEEPLCRFDAAEKKAQYLSWLGHNADAVGICEGLLKQPYLSEGDKDRMRQLIKSFLSKTLGEWR